MLEGGENIEDYRRVSLWVNISEYSTCPALYSTAHAIWNLKRNFDHKGAQLDFDRAKPLATSFSKCQEQTDK